LSFACFDTAGLKQGKKMLSPVLRMCEKGLNKLKIDNNLKLLQASLPDSLSLDCKQALREICFCVAITRTGWGPSDAAV
jgi:hypothetical protein